MRTMQVLGTVERVLEWGSSASTLLAPEKSGQWGKALLLCRCLRFELERPEHAERMRRAAAATQGSGRRGP
jgi:hypothetical protein